MHVVEGQKQDGKAGRLPHVLFTPQLCTSPKAGPGAKKHCWPSFSTCYLTIKSEQLFTSFHTAHVAHAHSIRLGSQHLPAALRSAWMPERLGNLRETCNTWEICVTKY